MTPKPITDEMSPLRFDKSVVISGMVVLGFGESVRAYRKTFFYTVSCFSKVHQEVGVAGLTMDRRSRQASIERELQIEGYLTTEYLASLWDERSRQVDQYREENPDDRKGIDLRQNRATAVLQAYRFLSTLEQQLGVRLALPILDRPDTTADR